MTHGYLSRRKGHKKSGESPDGAPEDETGEFLRPTMLDMDSRLRVTTAVEQNETLASQQVFESIKRRGTSRCATANPDRWLGRH